MIKDENRTITCKRSFELKSFIIKFTTIYAHKQNRAAERSMRGNNKAYQIVLPGEYSVSASFNVTDLSP